MNTDSSPPDQSPQLSPSHAGSLPAISEAEWKVMKVIWKRSPITANDVVAELEPAEQWKPKTIHTLLRRLVQKGALGFQKKGREFHFIPQVDEHACLQAASRSFLGRFFNGELAPLLSFFVESERLSTEQINELQKILKEKKP